LLVFVVAAITIILSAAISIWISRYHNWYVSSIGTIRITGVKAYEGDLKVQDGKSYIDWGTVYPGTSIDRSFYIQSESNHAVTLELEVENLTFQDSEGKNITAPTNSYMNLTWNYTNTSINPGQVIYVTLNLSVSPDVDFVDYLVANNVTAFGFDVHIFPSNE
jgi:hypothetical protein